MLNKFDAMQAMRAKSKEARISQLPDLGIRVLLNDRKHFRQQNYDNPDMDDVFYWTAGYEIEEFYKRMGIDLLSVSVDDDTFFYFPEDRADAAMLFKLTFV